MVRLSLQKAVLRPVKPLRGYLVLLEGIVSFTIERESERSQSGGWMRRLRFERENRRD